MRTICSNNAINFTTSVFAAAFVILLAGCGASGAPTTTTTTGTAPTAATISLATTATSVKSDGSTSITLTATVLTTSNSVLSGQTVNFAASTGQVSASSATTNTSGQASITFSAGTSGINRTATISATVNGTTVTSSIPVQISGSTLTLSAASTSVAAGTPVVLSILAKDAGGTGVANQTQRISITSTSTGSGSLSAASTTTDSSGNATVTLTGSAAGTVNVLVEWLDSAGTSVTASATKSFTITSVGNSFAVTTPATSPYAVSIGANQLVTVSIPPTINGTAISSIRYATTLGTWQASGTKVLTVTPVGTSDTQTFVPGTNAGNATIQIDALSATNAVLTSVNITLSISAPSSTANSITLQSSASVLPPSSGSTLSTTTLTAIVRDNSISKNPVGGAPVLFELVNSSGTGESISPVVVITDSTSNGGTLQMGRAQATFTAGTSTTQGAQVKATVVGTAITATTPITVGGTAGSIAIGTSTTMTSINSDTAYQIPVTVMVSDSNGNAVSGAVVSLSLWPYAYYKGSRAITCEPIYFGYSVGPPVTPPTEFLNEDLNENLILDAGEDVDGPGGYLGTAVLDSKLWPALSAAGSIPSTVTTGVDGTATFNWVYLKEYAHWVVVRIRATTQVQGSQSTAESRVFMKALATDVKSPCPLSASPFN